MRSEGLGVASGPGEPTVGGLEHHGLAVGPDACRVVGLHSGVVGAVEVEAVHSAYRLLAHVHFLKHTHTVYNNAHPGTPSQPIRMLDFIHPYYIQQLNTHSHTVYEHSHKQYLNTNRVHEHMHTIYKQRMNKNRQTHTHQVFEHTHQQYFNSNSQYVNPHTV